MPIIDPTANPAPVLPYKQRLDAQAAEAFSQRIAETYAYAVDQMHLAQALQADNANRNRMPTLVYRKDDLVYVSIRNWGTDRDAKKLDFRFSGPHRILKVLLYNAYYLELLPDIQKYPVFYSNLLRRADNDLLLGQISPAEGPPLLIHVERDNRGDDE